MQLMQYQGVVKTSNFHKDEKLILKLYIKIVLLVLRSNQCFNDHYVFLIM